MNNYSILTIRVAKFIKSFTGILTVAWIGRVSPSVAITFEVEINVQNSTLKCAFESLLVRIFPFFVHNPESL